MRKKEVNKRDVEFLYEIGTLRNVERNWRQVLGPGVATVLDHTVRTVFIALLIARMEGERNEARVIKMALAHDLTEARTGDTNAVHAVYSKRDDATAAKDLCDGTQFGDFASDILKEYQERKSHIYRIVKDADNLDVELELLELMARGSDTAKRMRTFRRKRLLKVLYTKSAKQLLKAFSGTPPASWFLASNKWVKLKNAGK